MIIYHFNEALKDINEKKRISLSRCTTMCHLNEALKDMNEKEMHLFVQRYSLEKSIKTFGDTAVKSRNKEVKQVHARVAFKPITVEELTSKEHKQEMESLFLLRREMKQ